MSQRLMLQDVNLFKNTGKVQLPEKYRQLRMKEM